MSAADTEASSARPVAGRPDGNAVSGMFARIAGRYDLANHLLSGGVDYHWRRVVTKRVQGRNPQDLVDLATGSGDLAFALRDRLGPEPSITGLDFCEPMLEEAREKRVRKDAYRGMDFAFGDCMALPLEDASVDAVTIAFGVRNFEDRQRGFREIHRVLRPGGYLYILEFSQPDRWFRPFYFFYLKYVLPHLASLATGDKGAYDYLAGSIEAFPSKEDLSAQVLEAGFSSVEASALTFGIVALHEAVK